MHGYCSECHEPCEIVSVDVGIGPYEFQGQRGFDSRIVPGSSCCEAPCLSEDEWNERQFDQSNKGPCQDEGD
jgi:hypothetical protein